ncbi:hypothetical protein FJT64_025184 [Amphibalanus amphitrite]|uniref:Uncharacterized protein n=1 Tax=Amphibalanus amphitrite TaxID=1232801 RepID=A0A6A4W606_AMPAM|nr:hypothetical protein FJT64_025184 [Amphibalanus amphitrite]
MWSALTLGLLCIVSVAAQLDQTMLFGSELRPMTERPSALRNNTDDEVLSLDVYLQILRQMQVEDLLPSEEAVGLTLCGDLFAEAGLPYWPLDGPLTVRTCRRCQGPFRAELLLDRPMLPRALLQGAGCQYWPGARPLPHWSPRPAVLLGRLDCRAALLRPELDRLPDALCLQLDGLPPGTAERTGRLFRRTFALRAVREIGAWNSSGGLQVTDRRTGVQPNGRIIADGSPLRVAYEHQGSRRYHCEKSPHDNRTCSSVSVHTRLPAFGSTQLELGILQIPSLYNLTLEIVDPKEFPARPSKDRMTPERTRAIGLMVAGGADRIWPSSMIQPWMYQLPISVSDDGYMIPFSFMTVRQPPQLRVDSLFRLFSPGTWAAIGVSTLLVAVLLSRILHRSSVAESATTALALLLGQSLPLGRDRLPARHRPLVAVWVAMSLILTTAFLSDLIKALTVPRSQPPETVSDLVQRNYRLFSDFPIMQRLYSHSARPLVRHLARDMSVVRYDRKELLHTMLQERSAYSMALPAMLETMAEVMIRSQGSVQFEDFAFGREAFDHMVIGQLWSKHHPLLAHRIITAHRLHASGILSTQQFEQQAQHLGRRLKARACARRQASCYTGAVVRPLTVANLYGPLLLYSRSIKKVPSTSGRCLR